MTDLRTSRDRDEALLEQLVREGGFSFSWLIANRDRAASLHRLVKSGRAGIGVDWIVCERAREYRPGEFIEYKPVYAPSLLDRMRDWARRVKVWLVGIKEHE